MGPVTTIQFEEKVEGSCFAHAHKGGCVFLSISKFSITVLCLGSFGCCLSLAVFFSYAAWLLFLTKLPFQNNNNKLLTEMIMFQWSNWIDHNNQIGLSVVSFQSRQVMYLHLDLTRLNQTNMLDYYKKYEYNNARFKHSMKILILISQKNYKKSRKYKGGRVKLKYRKDKLSKKKRFKSLI